MTALGHRQLLKRSVAELLRLEANAVRCERAQPQHCTESPRHGSPSRLASPRPHTAPSMFAQDVERDLAAHQHIKLQERLIKAKSHAVIRMKYAPTMHAVRQQSHAHCNFVDNCRRVDLAAVWFEVMKPSQVALACKTRH